MWNGLAILKDSSTELVSGYGPNLNFRGIQPRMHNRLKVATTIQITSHKVTVMCAI